MTAELSASPFGKSCRRFRGTVPADSISQLVNVFLPNWVDFAVRRKRFRLWHWLDAYPWNCGYAHTLDGIVVTRRLVQ